MLIFRLLLIAAVVLAALPPRPSKGHARQHPLLYLEYVRAAGIVVDAIEAYRVRSACTRRWGPGVWAKAAP